jgi:hypothetical protein
MNMKRLHVFALTAAAAVALLPLPALAGSTDGPMYFHSQVRDAPTCAMTATRDGAIEFPDAISSPAATCPDAFGWAQFVEAVQARFWTQWANDETLWPGTPKPLCSTAGQTDCCFVDAGATPAVGYRGADGRVVKPANLGAPAAFCPYSPGDWGGAPLTTYKGGKAVTGHNGTILAVVDPGRVARQQEVEIIYRNDAFVRYTTAHELYSQAGLKKLFDRVAGEAANSIPHRPTGQGASYPSDAVMFKVDWIPEKIMADLGYVSDHDNDPKTPAQNAEHPYVTIEMDVSTDDGKTYQKGFYYLVAVTGAAKALPNWRWYAFEHVANKGRCDFTGCNDSYGYLNTVTVPSPTDAKKTVTFASNFIQPHVVNDGLDDKTDLFDLAKTYPGGDMTDGLAAIFAMTGIGGSTAAADPKLPKPGDAAWRSYRMKGTQTDYYNRDGYPTILGASVTEGGFVNTASCLSCHVQAGIDATGAAPGNRAVGSTGMLNMTGIGTVVSGAPYIGDYYDRGTTAQRAVQTDFVWGVLNAQ